MRHVVDEIGSASPGRSVRFESRTTGVPVRCDATRIAQLPSNLVRNGIEHGGEHGSVDVLLDLGPKALVLKVTNDGPPIPEALRESLFLPFQRGNQNRGRNEGLGLGLYIVAKIAEAHRGTVKVDSDDAATVFTVAIPVE